MTPQFASPRAVSYLKQLPQVPVWDVRAQQGWESGCNNVDSAESWPCIQRPHNDTVPQNQPQSAG